MQIKVNFFLNVPSEYYEEAVSLLYLPNVIISNYSD